MVHIILQVSIVCIELYLNNRTIKYQPNGINVQVFLTLL